MMGQRRLMIEHKKLQKNPVEFIEARPREDDVFEWHYVITGPPDSPYAGGLYWGKLVFPPQFPMKPPAVYMLTPNGRFSTNTRLCLSMSDFHPETWNPLWSVGTILTGLLSFMLEDTPTSGSIPTSTSKKRELARKSCAWNTAQPMFWRLFPRVAKEAAEAAAQAELQGQGAAGSEGGAGEAEGAVRRGPKVAMDGSLIYLVGAGVLVLAAGVAWLSRS